MLGGSHGLCPLGSRKRAWALLAVTPHPRARLSPHPVPLSSGPPVQEQPCSWQHVTLKQSCPSLHPTVPERLKAAQEAPAGPKSQLFTELLVTAGGVLVFLPASSAVLGQNHPLWAFFPVTAPTWPPFLSLLTVLSYKITFRNHLLQAAFPDRLPPTDPPGLLQLLLSVFIRALSSKEVIHPFIQSLICQSHLSLCRRPGSGLRMGTVRLGRCS